MDIMTIEERMEIHFDERLDVLMVTVKSMQPPAGQ
jgi:hypothetical protein